MAAVDERSGLPSLPDHGCCPFCNWSRKLPNKQPDDAFNEQQHAAREALHAGDRKSGDEKAALVRAIFAQCLVLLALREFAPLLEYMLPSDIVAFLACGTAYGSHRVLLHYGAFLFKNPSDQYALRSKVPTQVYKMADWNKDKGQRWRLVQRSQYYFRAIAAALRANSKDEDYNPLETALLDQRTTGKAHALESSGAAKKIKTGASGVPVVAIQPSNPRNQERASFDISESEEAIGRVEAVMSALRTPHRIPIEGLIRRLGRGAERVRHNRAMAWSNIYLQIIINFNGFPTEKQGRRPWVDQPTSRSLSTPPRAPQIPKDLFHSPKSPRSQ
jgi:hypothetical protein